MLRRYGGFSSGKKKKSSRSKFSSSSSSINSSGKKKQQRESKMGKERTECRDMHKEKMIALLSTTMPNITSDVIFPFCNHA